MQSFFYRLFSLLLRFSCPLVILAISDPAVLGKYYLFAAFFTLAVFSVSLEISIPFAKRYLAVKGEEGRAKVFRSLIVSQIVLAVVLEIPFCIFYWYKATISIPVVVMLFLALISEACVNEVGRFLWNIGATSAASRRDFIRAIYFMVAMVSSIWITGEVVSTASFAILASFNLVLLVSERKYFKGNLKRQGLRQRSFRRRLREISMRAFVAVKSAGPQIVHVQILSLMPFLERSAIEKTLGLAVVGSYAFQYSMVQSGASLLLLPAVAKARRIMLSEHLTPSSYKSSLGLVFKILTITAVGAVLTGFAIPIINVLMSKHLQSNGLLLFAVLFAAAASTYAAAVAPLYITSARLVKANLLTLLCMAPLIALIVTPGLAGNAYIDSISLVVIALAGLLQLLIRCANFGLSNLRSSHT